MDVINALHLRSRGHCSTCATPWGCFRPFCGCHCEPAGECAGCGSPLFVPMAADAKLSGLVAWLNRPEAVKQADTRAAWIAGLPKRRTA